MKKLVLFFLAALISTGCASSSAAYGQQTGVRDRSALADQTHVVVEPWTYSDDFEDRDLGAWASYPLWQDTAYDPNFRVIEIVPGDPNISIVQKVTPYTNVDNYAGAQKLLDMYLVPGATVRFRYYLKTNQPAEFFKVRFAAGSYGKVDVPVSAPQANKWVWVQVSYNDIIRHNPSLAGKQKIRIYALAFLAKIPDADPAMPFYLGLDDITFKGARATRFQFAEPAMYKLPEYDPYIPTQQYHRGESFSLEGRWPVDADRVQLHLASYTYKDKQVWNGQLDRQGQQWTLDPLELSFPDGLYLGTLTAYKDGEALSNTKFTIHIAPDNMKGKHPRLLFDAKGKRRVEQRFTQQRFQSVYEQIRTEAKAEREQIPVESLVYDLDQFPKENWLPTWSAWGSHIYHTGEALRLNARAYAFHDDQEAGEYVKQVLLKLADWPDWTHPWQTNRGRFSEHRTGSWSHRVAEAYDLTYNLMTPDERAKIRGAIMENIVKGAHRTYVYNDNVTSKTSNWINMVVGGSLMNMAAMYGDGPKTANLEPYFTGAMIKYYTFLQRVTDSEDGAWGEGLGYNGYTFSNTSYSAPSLKNVFNIDVTDPLAGTYNEYIWSGLIKKGEYFYFGDSGGNLNPLNSWAFLLDMQREARLSWFYNYLKYEEYESNTKNSNSPINKEELDSVQEAQTYLDVVFDIEDIPQDSPFDESPVRQFRQLGTTVFKSGWKADDFSFTMRTGPFYNHQHLDQGSFWLADRGITFIEERHGSTYYDDPLYQPWYTQPIGHSTILIDGNHQSQRVGDPRSFAPGFADHAFLTHFLDGRQAAFSSGDIGRLYWDKIDQLQRNVLYLKPRTLLMLDTAVPGKKDRKVTLLYQTEHLKDITAADDVSKITKQGVSLNMMHLAPRQVDVQAVETPHYLNTLREEQPLIKEGMLTVSARTSGDPLVIANLVTTTDAGAAPDVQTESGDGVVSGVASGKQFAFSTRPGELYTVGKLHTNALAVTWDGAYVFAAKATAVDRDGSVLMASDSPVTVEVAGDGTLTYYRSEPGWLTVGAASRPGSVRVNGEQTDKYRYDATRKTIRIAQVPAGKGKVQIQ